MLNNYEFQRYITTIARNSGLKVVWTEENEPRANHDSIFIPRGTINDTDDVWKQRLFFAVHEAGGHQRFTDFNLIATKGVNPKNSLLGLIHNACEDVRVDYLNAVEFDGDRQLTDEVMGRHFEDITEAIAKKSKSVDVKAQTYIENATPIMEFMVHADADMFRSYDAQRGKFASFLRTPEAKERFDKLCNTNKYMDEMHRARSIVDAKRGTKATWDLAVRIFEELFDGDAEKEQERCKEEAENGKGKPDGKDKGDGKPSDKKEGEGEGQDKGEPKDGEGDGKSKGKGEGEASGKGEEAGDGDASDSTDSEYKHVEVDYSDAIQDGGGRNTSRTDQTLKTDWEKRCDAPYTPATFNEHKVINCAKPGWENGFPSRERRDLAAAIGRTNPSFANQVRQKLQVRDRSRYEYAKKKGTMHRPSLHRVLIKDAPGYNERVFKNKVVSDTLNTAITVLVDSSGSMSGRKYEHAAASAVLLNESLGNTLHIPLEIVGFTEWGHSPVNIVHRAHDTKQLSKDRLQHSLEIAGCNLANNPDGENVSWAYERLIRRKEKRKLMIVISDGQPADCWARGDPASYLKHVVSTIEREKRIEIYAVGVMTEAVKHFYKEFSIINSSEQLESTLLQLIDRKVV
jgi:cobalamin biosynthesis protein CobT